MRRGLRFLGSLWLTFPLLAVMALVLAAGGGLLTFAGVSFIDIAIGALRLDVYGSAWFGALMGLLMVNLIVCTVIRTPWKFWQWGFLVTHTGVLTLMIGATVTYYFKIYGQMPLSEGQESSSFADEHARELRVWMGRDPDSDAPDAHFPLEYNMYRRQRPDDVFGLPEKGMFIRVEEFLPHVAERDAYVESPDGQESVIELEAGGGDGRSERLFLPEGRVLGFSPLEVEFGGISEDAFENVSAPAGTEGTLWIRSGGEEREIDIASSKDQAITVGGREFRIIGPADLGERGGRDSVVQFEATVDGQKEAYFISALHPDLTPMRRRDEKRETAFEARLRINVKASLMWFVRTSQGLRVLVTRSSGEKRVLEAPVGAPIRYPFMQVPFQLTVVRVLDKAVREPVEAKLRKDEQRRPAVRLRVSRGEWRGTTWLTYGMMRSIEVGGKRVVIGFMPLEHKLPFTVRCERVKVPVRPGTRQAARYESDITIFDPELEDPLRHTTGVNYPATHRGFVFYQASVQSTRESGVFDASVFQVAWDPGKKILYLGGLMTVSGTLFMLFLKPFLLKLLQRASAMGGPPMRDLGIIATLSLLSAGTLVGSAMMFARVPWSGVAVGFFVAGLDVLAVFVGCWVASRATAVKGLQIGQALSTTWLLNTAALVLFMWVKVLG